MDALSGMESPHSNQLKGVARMSSASAIAGVLGALIDPTAYIRNESETALNFGGRKCGLGGDVRKGGSSVQWFDYLY